MEPVAPHEKEALWPLRYGKALMTIVGTGVIPGSTNTNIIQQTDIFFSIKKLIGQWQVKVNKFFNDVFSSSIGRDWWVIFCRYFTNRYGVLTTTTSWAAYEYVSDVKNKFSNIYAYIQAYNGYQEATGPWAKTQTGTNNMVVIAHRGSHQDVTENSLEAFLLAKKNGANGIEFDVSQTRDRQNIVMHGPSLYSTTCGKNVLVGTHDLSWITGHCTLNNGEPIRTLEEMLNGVKWLFDYYFIEIKANTPNVEQQTLDAIETVKKLGMEDKVIFTSYDKTATYLLWSYKNIHAGRDTYNIGEIKTFPYFTHEYYLLDKTIVWTDTPQQIADMGKKLVVYVVNTRDELEKLFHQGVHIIMTDDVITMKEYADKLVLDQR